ncbi:Rz-like lysis system protein LysB [Pantoea sp. MQR6]|uniref:Rz-like lysis system protein LysB n=1 Tax=Pantoea sp. MQR6 TaxID=2907307 RepID=UPI001FA944D8
MKNIIVTCLFFLALVLWQSWNLRNAYQKIHAQEAVIDSQDKRLSQKNSQLIALNILTQTNSREQTRLYAAAEETDALLRTRQRRIEELTRENEEFRRWAAAPLPDAVVRLRTRPVITGGQAYREWLSKDNALPAAGVSPAQ